MDFFFWFIVFSVTMISFDLYVCRFVLCHRKFSVITYVPFQNHLTSSVLIALISQCKSFCYSPQVSQALSIFSVYFSLQLRVTFIILVSSSLFLFFVLIILLLIPCSEFLIFGYIFSIIFLSSLYLMFLLLRFVFFCFIHICNC